MDGKPTPNERFIHLQNYNTRLTRDQACHVTRRVCQDSNWPFTGDLQPQEIVCMRDSYFGKRQTPPCIPLRCAYDRVFHPRLGWNQGTIKDTREYFYDCLHSAKLEDSRRTVPVCVNATYGHYLKRFIDFTSKDNGRSNTCKAFLQHGPISTLPSIKDVDSKHPHD